MDAQDGQDDSMANPVYPVYPCKLLVGPGVTGAKTAGVAVGSGTVGVGAGSWQPKVKSTTTRRYAKGRI